MTRLRMLLAAAPIAAAATFASCVQADRAPSAIESRSAPTCAVSSATRRAAADCVAGATGPAPKSVETPTLTTTRVVPSDAKLAVPERVLSGRVVDSSGDPVAGAEVSLVSCWLTTDVVIDLLDVVADPDVDYAYPHMTSETITDAAGAFQVAFRDGGERTLRVRRAKAADVLVDGPTDGCVVRLPDARPTLAIHVVRADDATPVLGARIEVAQSELGALRGLSTRRAAETDADGRCRIDDGLAVGPALVTVRADGFSIWARDLVEVGVGASIDVNLSVGDVVEGVVIDDVSGATMSGAHVDGGVTSDGAGRFRAEHQLGGRITAWTEDPRWPWFTADSLWGDAPIAATGGVAADVTIRLRRPAETALRCIDASGAPIRDAIVAPSCGGAEPTDADGRARIRGACLVRDGAGVRLTFFVEGVRVFERELQPLAAGETRDLGDVVLPLPAPRLKQR